MVLKLVSRVIFPRDELTDRTRKAIDAQVPGFEYLIEETYQDINDYTYFSKFYAVKEVKKPK
jgi:hypothetical protein